MCSEKLSCHCSHRIRQHRRRPLLRGRVVEKGAHCHDQVRHGQSRPLFDNHRRVHDAVLGRRVPLIQDAVAILETDSVAANVRAAELAIKGTEVQLIELRLAEYELSGKAISIYNGALFEVEAAMTIAVEFLHGRKEYVQHRVISNPHEALTRHLADGTRFAAAEPYELDDEEVS